MPAFLLSCVLGSEDGHFPTFDFYCMGPELLHEGIGELLLV